MSIFDSITALFDPAKRRAKKENQLRRGMAQMKRIIQMLEKNEAEYIEKARYVSKRGLEDQLPMLKANIRRAIATRKNIERQLIAIDTAMQMRAEAEAINAFAGSMNAISSSISDLFGATDMVKMQSNFENAMHNTQSMKDCTEIFMDTFSNYMSSSDSAYMSSSNSTESIDVISDEALDKLIFANGLLLELEKLEGKKQH